MSKTADQHFPFRQDPGIFALSGLEQPDTILVLTNKQDNGSIGEMAFILPQDPANTIWNGDRLTKKEATKISGIKNIRSTDQWEKSLSNWMAHAKHIYLPVHGDDIYPAYGSANEKKIHTIRTLYPTHQFETTGSILRQMMMVKHIYTGARDLIGLTAIAW